MMRTLMGIHFHLVGRFGSEENIEAVLNWIDNDPARLALLKAKITDNDEDVNERIFPWLGNLDQKKIIKQCWTGLLKKS